MSTQPERRGRALVTGAAGFIGSHLVEALHGSGWEVRAFDAYNALGRRGWLEELDAVEQGEVEVVLGDVRDAGTVNAAMRGCDTVFHLAALIAIPYSYVAPRSYVDVNVTGTLNVLEAARNHGVTRFVHTSTSEVYGTAQKVPIDEAHPLVAQSPYAATKIAADQLAISFQRSFNLPVSVLRPFNCFGPRQSARAVIPTIITQIMSGAESLRLGALSPTRDFSYVGDTVAGFMALADAGPETLGRVYNLGSGFEITIGDLARLIVDLMGASVTVVEDPDRLRPASSEVERLLANAARARRELRWAPAVEGVEGLTLGLERTIEWFSSAGGRQGYRPEVYQL